MAGPGENAGVISIGDGLAVAFKIESHNHPSAVEPYQGAATGVGGILRDIFTMGARPIAILDALRFGDPADPRTRHLVDGVVRGVGGYGNCVGVPTVGGELVFDRSYEGNPLVNVMAIGLLDEERLTRAAAPGPGNLAVLFGSTTGRDGIGGASVLASATFGAERAVEAAVRPGRRPVRREAAHRGEPRAHRARPRRGPPGPRRGRNHLRRRPRPPTGPGPGILVDLDAIPRREPGLEPFEVMISESQERMLAIVRPERWEAVREVCERWGLPVAIVGRVTDDGDVAVVERRTRRGGPAATRARSSSPGSRPPRSPATRSSTPGWPRRRRGTGRRPAPGLAAERRRSAGAGDGPGGGPPVAARRAEPVEPGAGSTSSTTAPSRRTPSSGPVTAPRSCGSRARPRRSSRRPTRTRPSASSTPASGAALSVAEATRNVSITGARPLGVTNCLNYGDPTRPEAFWQLREARPRSRRRVPGARAAGHRRQRLALQRVARRADRADARDRGRRPARRRRDAGRPRLRRRRRRRDPRRVGHPGPRSGAPMPSSPGSAPEDGPPSLDLGREAAVQRFIREAIGARPRRVRPGRLRRRARRRGGGGLHLGRRRPRDRGDPPAPGRRRAGGRAVRREPVAADRRLSPASRPGARSCSPASTGSRSRSSARSAATGS